MRARLALVVGLTAAAWVQCHRNPPPAVPAGAPSLSVMTFNVNFGVADDPANVAAIAEANADLVLLQETTPRAEALFRAELADAYPHMVFSYCCRAGGLGILSKHPIVDREPLPPPVGWFPAERVVIDTPLGRTQVINVHLRPPISDDGSWVAGYFSTRSVRAEEIAALWASAEPSLPTIVAGDFNESRNGRAIEFLGDKGLRSALVEQHPRATTWRWNTSVGTLRAQLDHIVIDGHFRAVDTRVLERGRSDHMPVFAVLTAADPAAPPPSPSSLGAR
jgi:endonuclease/exonuclease/phosphatase (EEP) superfamily protein YafD